jgi:hypothetical protein
MADKVIVWGRPSAPAGRQQEDAMAKGKDKGNKEKKKPKADKNAPKSGGSSYQQSKGGKK